MKPKKTLTAFFLCFALSAMACGGYADLYPKWSIGVIGYGHFQMPHQGMMRSYVLPGVQFTHGNRIWGQRVAIEYTKYTETGQEFPQGGADMLYSTGYERRTMLRVGIERGWFMHRVFRPYAAVDIAGQFSRSDMYYSGGIMGMNQRDEVTTKGIGLLPAVGFKTFIGRRISIYAEYRAEAFLNDVDTKTTYYNGNIDARPTSEMNFDFKVGTIGLAGIQVMF